MYRPARLFTLVQAGTRSAAKRVPVALGLLAGEVAARAPNASTRARGCSASQMRTTLGTDSPLSKLLARVSAAALLLTGAAAPCPPRVCWLGVGLVAGPRPSRRALSMSRTRPAHPTSTATHPLERIITAWPRAC